MLNMDSDAASDTLHTMFARTSLSDKQNEYNVNTAIYIPDELIINIMKYMNIADKARFKQVSKRFNRIATQAMDICEYLSHTFKYPRLLLSSMSSAGSVISGSRALEYFVPESTSATSDWDFLVSGTGYSASTMVHSLSLNGVIWEDLSHKIVNTYHGVDRVNVNSIHLSYDHVCRLQSTVYIQDHIIFNSYNCSIESMYNMVTLYSADHPDIDPHMIYVLLTSHDDGLHMHVKCKESRIYDNQTNDYYIDNDKFKVLSGILKSNGKNVKIQLIIGKSYSSIKRPLQLITTYWATHIQCFIGGHYAAHMYYNTAKDKISKLWNNNASLYFAAVERARSKYELRGYKFNNDDILQVYYPWGVFLPIRRTLNDMQSIIIPFNNIYEDLPSYNALYQKIRTYEGTSITWIDDGNEVKNIHSPIEHCMNQPLNCLSIVDFMDDINLYEDALHTVEGIDPRFTTQSDIILELTNLNKLSMRNNMPGRSLLL